MNTLVVTNTFTYFWLMGFAHTFPVLPAGSPIDITPFITP